MKYKNKNKSGFTLVELLVVIAIIGILSSISVVNLNSARESAKDAATQETLNRLLNGVFLCLNNNENITSPIPIVENNICNNSDNKWPDLTENGWAWQDSSSTANSNTFCYTASKINADPGQAFRCKPAGCYEMMGVQMPDNDCGGIEEFGP